MEDDGMGGGEEHGFGGGSGEHLHLHVVAFRPLDTILAECHLRKCAGEIVHVRVVGHFNVLRHLSSLLSLFEDFALTLALALTGMSQQEPKLLASRRLADSHTGDWCCPTTTKAMSNDHRQRFDQGVDLQLGLGSRQLTLMASFRVVAVVLAHGGENVVAVERMCERVMILHCSVQVEKAKVEARCFVLVEKKSRERPGD